MTFMMKSVWRPEGKRQLLRPRRRWPDDIEMDLRETGIYFRYFVKSLMNVPVP